MLEVQEWVGEEIWEVDPFLWTSDKAASEQVATVITGNTKFVTVQRSLWITKRFLTSTFY